MRRATVLAATAALLCCAGRNPAPRLEVAAGPSDRFDAIVIDAGHGGKDRGARGAAGLIEKDLVLDVSRRLAKRLEARGIEVVMTRLEDVTVSLERRASIANDAGADLFVSIHANSSRSAKPRGIETYFMSLEATDAGARETAERENLAFGVEAPPAAPADPMAAIFRDMIGNEVLRESKIFAGLAQKELGGIARVPSRGVKQAPFVVLDVVRIPAALVEIGFLSNPDEERALRRERSRDEIAAALERAVLTYRDQFDTKRGAGESGR